MNEMNDTIDPKKLEKSAAREWVESIIIAFILAMFIRTFFIQAFKIPSGSMRMTLIEGDRLIVNKIRFGPKVPFSAKRLPGLTEPMRGDIIVFVFPGKPKKDFIKRIVAVGGDTVEIKFGDVYINGEILEVPVIKRTYYYNRGPFGKIGYRAEVPEGHYFVLGDNSVSSHDSRFWGYVPERNVIGKAELIYWPLNRMRFLK